MKRSSIFGIDELAGEASREFGYLRDLETPNSRAVRGEMGGMPISGHPGQDALYGRPRQDGSMLRAARRAAEPGTQTDKPPGGHRTSLDLSNPIFVYIQIHSINGPVKVRLMIEQFVVLVVV